MSPMTASPSSIRKNDAIQLSWIMPMYRTADMLEELLRRVRTVAEDLNVSYELILVDDACPQGSAAQARAIAGNDPRVRILETHCNRGQDQALLHGLMASRGEWCLIMDADLEDPPEAVPALWTNRHPDIDVIFARRTGSCSRPDRRLTSLLYRQSIRWVGGLPPGACLFALLSRPAVNRIVSQTQSSSWLMPLIAASGRRFVAIPINREARPSGRSGHSSWRRLRKAAGTLSQMLRLRYFPRARSAAARHPPDRHD
ncbi:MAG: glycosyltransferase [Lysobacteraceae bacterium]